MFVRSAWRLRRFSIKRGGKKFGNSCLVSFSLGVGPIFIKIRIVDTHTLDTSFDRTKRYWHFLNEGGADFAEFRPDAHVPRNIDRRRPVMKTRYVLQEDEGPTTF